MKHTFALMGLCLALFVGVVSCGATEEVDPIAVPSEVPMDREFVYRLKILGID